MTLGNLVKVLEKIIKDNPKAAKADACVASDDFVQDCEGVIWSDRVFILCDYVTFENEAFKDDFKKRIRRKKHAEN